MIRACRNALWGMAVLVAMAGCARQEADHAPAADTGHAHEDGHAHEEATHPDEAGHHGAAGGAHAGEDAHEEGHEHAEGEANRVKLPMAQQARIGLTTQTLGLRALDETLTTTGEFEANADREAHVSARVPGRVVKLYKTVGARVRAGEALALIESFELGQAQADYLEAQARRDLAQSTLERQQKLYKGDLTAKKELEAAQSQVRLAQITSEKTRNQLELFGMTSSRVAALGRNRRLDATLPLLAPISGVVIAKHATLGEVLEAGGSEPDFVVSDLSLLWVNARLYERDLARVQEGQSVKVTTPAYPGRTYAGRVSLISTAMEKETRTAIARIVVANTDGRVKPEMFATIAIRLGAQEKLAIPQQAVIQEKEALFAFVREGAETFERRPITVGPPTGGYRPVLSGLERGDEIVVDGGFTLKAELLKSSFGEHHH